MSTTAVVVNDHSIASLSGSSQTLVNASNGTRSFLLIFNNNSADNIGVNLSGGTAVIGGAGTVTLVPNGSIVFSSGSIPGNAITVIGANSGDSVVCQTSP